MSMVWTVDEVLSACKGAALARGTADKVFETVSTDTRTIVRGALFVALEGDRFDGHEFLGAAVEAGAAGVLIAVDKKDRADEVPGDIAVIVAPDTLDALGDLARARRRAWGGRLGALTGSNGKSSTKEMCWSILSAAGVETLKNEGNLNNLVGLPLTLLKLSESHAAAIVEMGTNAPGEIDRLAGIAEADVAALLNVGAAHLQGLGSLEGVAREKGAIYEHLGPGRVAVVNLDDELAREQAPRAGSAKVVTFGTTSGADSRVFEPISVEPGLTRFRLDVRGEIMDIALRLTGRHQAVNAAAAAAMALELGASLEAVKSGLAAVEPMPGRFVVTEAAGVRLIDDTYNANPVSMKAALTAAASLKGDARLVFIAGRMMELGSGEAELHRRVGAYAVETGAEIIAALAGAEDVARGAVEAGASLESCPAGMAPKDLAAWLADRLEPGDVVLVKGSRAARTEQVLDALREVLG